MHRRTLLLGSLAALAANRAQAAERMLGTGPAGEMKRVYVREPTVIRQQCPAWCWAASAAMIFGMHGHRIDQVAIVDRVFGGTVCRTSPGLTIAQVLSDRWIDAAGQRFQSRVVAAYDFAARIDSIDSRIIVDELANDRPLLYGNRHHAMVVAQVDYTDTPNGPAVQAVGVFDPWPYSPPFHTLTRAEILGQNEGGDMGFLAAVQVRTI